MLAILVGGRGTRMGIPKAQLQLAGKPILEWMHGHYQWPGPTMLVTAPAVTVLPRSDLFDRRVVDPIDDLGPMRGITTALENASTDVVAIVTVDMPGISREVIKWLINALAERSALDGLMCSRRIEHRDLIEAFPAVFRMSALDTVRRRLQSGNLSVKSLCDQMSIQSIASPDDWPENTWVNLNHPVELAAVELEIQKSGDRHETENSRKLRSRKIDPERSGATGPRREG
ncbi:hypothetical protein BH10PLA1_BH10PLA1_05580 [soil metagenome]